MFIYIAGLIYYKLLFLAIIKTVRKKTVFSAPAFCKENKLILYF